MVLHRAEIAVDSSTWAAVTAPVDCVKLLIKNTVNGANDVYTRSSSTNAATQDVLLAGAIEPYVRESGGTGILKGETILYLKSVAGTFVVRTEWR